VQPRVSAVQSGSVWLSQGGLGSCQLQARPGVVGSGLGPFTGAWPYPAFPACPAGRGAHFPQPRKKGLGAVCRGHVRAMVVALVVERLPIGLAGAKAGHQRLGRHTLPSLSPPSSPSRGRRGGWRGEGWRSKSQANRDSRGGSYFLVRGEIL